MFYKIRSPLARNDYSFGVELFSASIVWTAGRSSSRPISNPSFLNTRQL